MDLLILIAPTLAEVQRLATLLPSRWSWSAVTYSTLEKIQGIRGATIFVLEVPGEQVPAELVAYERDNAVLLVRHIGDRF